MGSDTPNRTHEATSEHDRPIYGHRIRWSPPSRGGRNSACDAGGDLRANTRLITIGVCQGSASAEPTWNFIELRIVLDPTNFSPANYTVTRNVWSDGKIVARFPTTQRLVIGEKVILTSYIPIRTDEIDLIDTVAVTYNRL